MTIDQDYTALTAEVRIRLVKEFSLEELRDLCFDLGIDYELFPQQQPTMARELVGYLQRRRRIPQLIEQMKVIRPQIDYGFTEHTAFSGSVLAQPSLPIAPHQDDESGTFEVVWSRQLDAQPHQINWLLGNTCIIPANTESNGGYTTTLFSLDASVGEMRWRHQFERFAFGGVADYANGSLISLSSTDVLTGEAVVAALAADGHIRWQVTCDGHHVSAPAVLGQRGLVVVDGYTCVVLDVVSGTELNRFTLPEEASSSAPLATESLVYFPCRGPRLIAMTWAGDEEWLFDAGTTSRVSLGRMPVLLDQRLVTVTNSGLVIALRIETGTVDWEYDPGVRLHSVAPVLSDGQALYIGGDSVLFSLSADTGEELWTVDAKDLIPSTLTLAGTMLVIADSNGGIVAYHAQTGQVLWKHHVASRINSQLTVIPDNLRGPMVICTDALGKVTAFLYPVTAAEHEQAHRWDLAAKTWESKGECVRAAKAWERHAQYLDGHGALDSLQAKAWESAAKMWIAVGEAVQADRCQHNRARFLELPIISVTLEHKGVILDAYSQLHLVLENTGYGTALDVQLAVHSDAFEIGEASELNLAHLAVGQKRVRSLVVRPTAYGETVPLQITMGYNDSTGRTHRVRDTIYVSVVRESTQVHSENLALFSRTSLHDMQDTRTEVVMDVFIRPGRNAHSLEIVLDDGQTFTATLPLSIVENLPDTGLKSQGQYLFEQMFGQGEARDAWNNALGQSLANNLPRRMRLRIDDALPDVASLAWETMYAGDLMLAAGDQILFSRNLPVKWVDRTLDISQPLKVLLVVSSPDDIFSNYQLPPLDAEEEKRILTRALKQQTYRDVQLHMIKSPVTLERLRRAARSGYHMMHIIGHGYVNPRSGTSGMILETSNQRSRAVSWLQLAQLFAQISDVPMLMYFSVCQRSSPHFELQPQTLPATMIRAGIPAVVAMQDRIGISANRVLTQQFYSDLLEHGSVDLALQSARAAVLAAELTGAEIPVLYSQLTSGRLW